MKNRRQVLGQNFLHHKPTIAKIIDAASQIPSGTKTILEVGPGTMALTVPLRELAQAKGLKFMAVERDRNIEAPLRERIAEGEIEFLDAATPKFGELLKSLTQERSIYVVSNLPYSASSQILAQLCYHQELISGAVVMVQKEMAQRIAAQAKTEHRGAFSLFIQTYFTPKLLFDVGPGAFSPPPKVTSTVLSLTPLEQPAIDKAANPEAPQAFERFCKMLFSQRRKMIRNSVPEQAREHFAKLGIDGTERPEELSLQTILDLFRRA